MSDPQSFEDFFNEQNKGAEGNALGGHLWDGMVKAMGFEDTEHMRLHNQNKMSEKLHEQYKGQPGTHGFDDQGGEAHYQIQHPSGWQVRNYGGPNLEIGHAATPGEAHDAIDVGWNGESDHDEHEIHPSMVNGSPEGNHSMLKRVLDDWVNNQGADYASSIPKIKRWQARNPMKNQAMKKQAHDSGDGETIYHCPFCGSGQVIARSDRTIECEFCHTCFTVQVQPEFSAFPQTIDGQPVQVPGMPGEIGQDPGQEMDPNGNPMGEDPNAAGAMASGAGADGNAPQDEGDDPSGDDSTGGNPFTSMLTTASGKKVAYNDYVAHLAVVHSTNRNQTIAQIQTNRRARG